MKFDLQKADLWKRISAFLFDFILLIIVITGIAAAASAILNYDKYYDIIEESKTKIYEHYGADVDITPEEYEKLTPDEKKKHEDAENTFLTDPNANYAYYMIQQLMLAITSISIVVGCFLMEFIVPLFLNHGRTLGKRIFGLAVIRTNGVKISGQAHFIRSVIGKTVIEILVPIFLIILTSTGKLGILGIILLLLLVALEIFALVKTKNTRSTIHDLISDTVVVDMPSQIIFDSEEALAEYKAKIHAETVANADY